MMKNMVKLEHVIGDRVFHFLCDNDSPLNEVKDAVLEFLKYVGKIEDQVKAQQAQAEAQKAADEAAKVAEESKVEELKAE